MEHTLDATNKSLGRVASEAALLLRGKENPSFLRHVKPTNKVKILNASQLKITGNKRDGKVYLRHSGYPGGQKKETLAEMETKKGLTEALRLAVYGMLPDNKLRSIMMNNLNITE